MTWRSGLYRRLFTSAQNSGALPRVCTKLSLSRPSTRPRRIGSPLVGSGSRRTICSVSLKLDVFPCLSMPREKYRVPARWRERRDMRRKRRSRLLMEAERSSMARGRSTWLRCPIERHTAVHYGKDESAKLLSHQYPLLSKGTVPTSAP